MGEYAEQDARNAEYALFLGDDRATFDPSKLTELDHRKVSWKGFILRATIIGESHIFEVEGCAIEALSCKPFGPLGMIPTLRRDFRRSARFECQVVNPQVSCAVSAFIHDPVGEADRHCLIQMMPAGFDPIVSLRREFPARSGSSLQEGPCTIFEVGCALGKKEVRFQSLTTHEYETAAGTLEAILHQATFIVRR